MSRRMMPTLDPKALRKTGIGEYAVRFLFGGAVAVGTGLVAERYGPVIGGLFLAFPAILPASLTLVERHDGRSQAADDARGAALGSVGLAAFALVAWRSAGVAPAVVVLGLATFAWAAISVGVWFVLYGSVRPRNGRSRPSRPIARLFAVPRRHGADRTTSPLQASRRTRRIRHPLRAAVRRRARPR